MTAADADGASHPGKLLYGAPGYALFDSMAVDGDGWVCQATLIAGGITQIAPDAATVEMALSDPMITNICFGGADRRMAFITCSSTGHLIRARLAATRRARISLMIQRGQVTGMVAGDGSMIVTEYIMSALRDQGVDHCFIDLGGL